MRHAETVKHKKRKVKSIGIRCWKDKFSYVVLTGAQSDPQEIDSQQIKLPKNCSRPEQLAWVRREIHEILNKFDCSVAFYKAVEPISRSKYMQRAEVEGIVQEATFSHESEVVIESRIKIQINSNTNARNAKYLCELLEHDSLRHLPKSKYEDATLVALSGLPSD